MSSRVCEIPACVFILCTRNALSDSVRVVFFNHSNITREMCKLAEALANLYSPPVLHVQQGVGGGIKGGCNSRCRGQAEGSRV